MVRVLFVTRLCEPPVRYLTWKSVVETFRAVETLMMRIAVSMISTLTLCFSVLCSLEYYMTFMFALWYQSYREPYGNPACKYFEEATRRRDDSDQHRWVDGSQTELLELLEDERRSAARPSRSRRRKSKIAVSTTQQQQPPVITPQRDSSVPRVASVTALSVTSAAKSDEQEPCLPEVAGDNPQPDATNASDICSMGGGISSASWDFGSGIDDTGVSNPLRLIQLHLVGQHVECLLAGGSDADA